MGVVIDCASHQAYKVSIVMKACEQLLTGMGTLSENSAIMASSG